MSQSPAERDGGVVQLALSTPWKVVNEVRRLLTLPYSRAYFAVHGVRWGTNWRVFGTPLIQRHRHSVIVIGRGLRMRNWFSANPLGIKRPSVLSTWTPGARLSIGDDVSMSGAAICAWEKIDIGSRVRIGANSTIVDSDFHPVSPTERSHDPRAGASAPVVIEDDVFLGMNSLILKGVRVGRGAVVGAGSVVASSVDPHTIVAGNPARPVATIADA